jgi:hypothetical protein
VEASTTRRTPAWRAASSSVARADDVDRGVERGVLDRAPDVDLGLRGG